MWTPSRGERSSSIVAWHTSRCRVAATTRKFIPTIKTLLPKGLAATFHTDLHWSLHAQQNHGSPKGPSRPLLRVRRENEQSNETSAPVARYADSSCGLNCSASSSTSPGVACHTRSRCEAPSCFTSPWLPPP